MSNSKRNKSLVKGNAARVLADTFLAIQRVANAASKVDSAIVKIAARGVHYAAQLDLAEIDANKRGIENAARDLVLLAKAHAATHSPMTRAAMSFGEALAQYRANEYGAACLKAATTQDCLR